MDVYIFITDGVFLIILRGRLIITKTSLWNTPGNILGRQKADNKTAALLSSCLHWAVFPSQSVLSVQGVNMCRQQAGEEPYLFLSELEEQTNTRSSLSCSLSPTLSPPPVTLTVKNKTKYSFFRLPQSATSCKLSPKSSVDLSQPFTLLQPQHCFNKLP